MNNDTLLHRQVHPSWVQNDVVSTQVFTVASLTFNPSPKDNGQLSVYNGEKFTAEDSYNHYTATLSSAGVLSVSIEEVDSVGELTTVENNYPFDGHSYIDFNSVASNGKRSKKAQKLRDIAVLRGWTYKI